MQPVPYSVDCVSATESLAVARASRNISVFVPVAARRLCGPEVLKVATQKVAVACLVNLESIPALAARTGNDKRLGATANERNAKKGKNKMKSQTIQKHVQILKRLAAKNHGKVPSYTVLERNGYFWSYEVARKHPERFAHLTRAVRRKRFQNRDLSWGWCSVSIRQWKREWTACTNRQRQKAQQLSGTVSSSNGWQRANQNR